METAGQQRKTATGRPFVPGVCPNPKGRPRKTDAQRETERVTRKTLDAALERMLGPALAVMHRALKSNDEALALRAAVDIADRVGGRAVQRTELNAQINGPESVRQVTPQMLRMAAQRLLASQATDVIEADHVGD
jgi:hypothetical protein